MLVTAQLMNAEQTGNEIRAAICVSRKEPVPERFRSTKVAVQYLTGTPLALGVFGAGARFGSGPQGVSISPRVLG